MRGLISKSVRESALITAGLALGAGLAMGSITFVVPQLASGLQEFMLAVPFIRGMVSAMMGVDIGPDLTITTMLSVLWTHPVVLALVSTHAIVLCARYPAGEIDRGTIDILLGWPVSRRGKQPERSGDAQCQPDRENRADDRAAVAERVDQLVQVFDLESVVECVAEAVGPVEERERTQDDDARARDGMTEHSERLGVVRRHQPAERERESEEEQQGRSQER
jgi:hypothetical protein